MLLQVLQNLLSGESVPHHHDRVILVLLLLREDSFQLSADSLPNLSKNSCGRLKNSA